MCKLDLLHELLLIFACSVLGRVTDLMYGAQLDGGLRGDSGNGVGKDLESVHAGDGHVLHSPVLKGGQDTQLKAGTFAFRYVLAQQFLSSFSSKCQYIIYGTGYKPALFIHCLVVGRVKPDNRICEVKREILPALCFRKNAVRHAACRLGRYAVAELFLKEVTYLVRTVAYYRPMRRSANEATRIFSFCGLSRNQRCRHGRVAY